MSISNMLTELIKAADHAAYGNPSPEDRSIVNHFANHFFGDLLGDHSKTPKISSVFGPQVTQLLNTSNFSGQDRPQSI